MDTRSIPKKLRRLRGKLIAEGFTYKSFAKERGFNARTVKAAVRGERAGEKAQEVIRAITSL